MADRRLAAPHPTDAANRTLLAGVGLLGLAVVVGASAGAFQTAFFLGLCLIFGGCAQLVNELLTPRHVHRHVRVSLTPALLCAFTGIVLVINAFEGLRVTTRWLLALFLADGAFLVLTALLWREVAWTMRLLGGLVSLALGLWMYLERATPTWSLPGVLVAIMLGSRAMEIIATSIRMRASALPPEPSGREVRT